MNTCPMVAEALDMLHLVMRLASHGRIVIAIEMAGEGGAFILSLIFIMHNHH